ncbi:hypothetical protein [Dactylosporangium sp. NPDC006015]
MQEVQPWRWRIDQDGLALHADWHQRLADTDPDGRLVWLPGLAAWLTP